MGEMILTKDTAPVNVDAVLLWKVFDPRRAALDVADYRSAIGWASRTALRDETGKAMLADMPEGGLRSAASCSRLSMSARSPGAPRSIPWRVKAALMPSALEDAMSMQAQAERERQARVILGDSERHVAEKFGEAVRTYATGPVALHLGAANMLYERLKQNSTIVIVPSTAVDTREMGGPTGETALSLALGQRKALGDTRNGVPAGEDGPPAESSVSA